MFSREPFTAPERFYRPGDNLRTAPFPRVSSLTRGAVGAGMVVTREGVSRLECSNVCTVVFARSLHSLSGVSHPKEMSVPTITISTNNRISKDEVHKTSWVKASSALFIHDLDLLVDHLAGKPIDSDVHPVVLFPFHDEIVLKIVSAWLVVT